MTRKSAPRQRKNVVPVSSKLVSILGIAFYSISAVLVVVSFFQGRGILQAQKDAVANAINASPPPKQNPVQSNKDQVIKVDNAPNSVDLSGSLDKIIILEGATLIALLGTGIAAVSGYVTGNKVQKQKAEDDRRLKQDELAEEARQLKIDMINDAGEQLDNLKSLYHLDSPPLIEISKSLNQYKKSVRNLLAKGNIQRHQHTEELFLFAVADTRMLLQEKDMGARTLMKNEQCLNRLLAVYAPINFEEPLPPRPSSGPEVNPPEST